MINLRSSFIILNWIVASISIPQSATAPAPELTMAILDNKLAVVESLIKSTQYDLTAQGFLAKVRSEEMARLLVRYGAKPNEPSKTIGLLPLEEAVRMAVQTTGPTAYATVHALLAVGVDPNARTRSGLTLMEVIISRQSGHGRTDILDLLLRHGLDARKRYGAFLPTREMKYPVAGAAFHGRLDQIKVLLKHGASLRVFTFEGNTVLHVATLENKPGNREVVAFLLKNGVDRECRNGAGERAIDIAKRKKYKEMVALLSR